MAMLAEASPVVQRVVVRVLPDGRLNRRNAAKYLGVAAKTLAMWQIQDKGPPSRLVGGRRFYDQAALDRFIRGDTPPQPAVAD